MHTTPLSPEDTAELVGFELLGRIGHGGMGQVFLGESQGGEPAAVKVIKPTVVDSESRQRFAQEIEILKTVWGPRIAAFLGADPEAEQPWLATEYVDGPDLGKHLTTRGPLPSLLVASRGATLAEALAWPSCLCAGRLHIHRSRRLAALRGSWYGHRTGKIPVIISVSMLVDHMRVHAVPVGRQP
ncbi:protein kinase [Streptomyces sp. NPDC102451]|uniref:protein kinase domain-containing protein n=1 Tax=Streptomyces sp. NPDC102451 TaxID=3366177 RepID=UPI0037FA694C